jgi:hypothetical protein
MAIKDNISHRNKRYRERDDDSELKNNEGMIMRTRSCPNMKPSVTSRTLVVSNDSETAAPRMPGREERTRRGRGRFLPQTCVDVLAIATLSVTPSTSVLIAWYATRN